MVVLEQDVALCHSISAYVHLEYIIVHMCQVLAGNHGADVVVVLNVVAVRDPKVTWA
jgi:hypothetical protein